MLLPTPSSDWLIAGSISSVKGVPSESIRSLVVSTDFRSTDKLKVTGPGSFEVTPVFAAVLRESVRVLEFGGVLFVYGIPRDLAFLADSLSDWAEGEAELRFKYWVTLDIDDIHRNETLKPSSQGLLMFLKCRRGQANRTPFLVNPANARVPHRYCRACFDTLKDWGGKKHLMHPLGTAISDVWRDLPKTRLSDHVAPDAVLARALALTRDEGTRHLHVVHSGPSLRPAPAARVSSPGFTPGGAAPRPNQVVEGDSIELLRQCVRGGRTFDLVFADPPYNLNKAYDVADDGLADREYLDWCDEWLDLSFQALKPGGSLFILNLPKWAFRHVVGLSGKMHFRHWITWEALSDPRGKIMPAHYALLYFTKPGGPITFNYSGIPGEKPHELVEPPDAPHFCLRPNCLKHRKSRGDDDRAMLSDVWYDIHRIKHRRDRDAHPCQLPEKFMERIIKLASNPGDVVFDPFCGTGTTAVVAKQLGRRYLTVDSNPNFVRIAREKLAACDVAQPILPRQSIRRPRGTHSKRQIEMFLQDLARRIGRVPSEIDIGTEMLAKIDAVYPRRTEALKRCRIALGI